MAKVVNTLIKRHLAKTSSWNALNPVLPDMVLGFEVTEDLQNPVGVKMGDGVRTWSNLPYWFSYASNRVILLPNDPRVNISGTTVKVTWDASLRSIFGVDEANFKILGKNGSEYQQIPAYNANYIYNSSGVSAVYFAGVIETDFKIIITI